MIISAVKIFLFFVLTYTKRHYSRAIWSIILIIWAPKLNICVISVSKIYKFMVNYDKYSQQSRNICFESSKTLKLLWFLEPRQWTSPRISIWVLQGSSQLPLCPRYIDTPLSYLRDLHLPNLSIYTYTHTDRHRQTDRQTDRQTQTDRHTHTHTHRQIDR